MSEEEGRRFDARNLVRTLSQPRRLVDRLALAVALGPPLAKGGRRLPSREYRRRIGPDEADGDAG